jgi:protein TonB
VGQALRTHPHPAVPGPAPRRDARPAPKVGAGQPLFAALQAPPRLRRPFGVAASLAVHAAVVLALILLPLLTHEELPVHRDYIRALLYAPPPPPPLPPPKGSPVQRETAVAKPRTPVRTREPALTMPAELAPESAPAADANADDPESWGDPAGSEAGVPEGMEGGVEGGMVGGVPGGVIGGVIGGTGDVPVPVTDYDQAPRVIRQVKPLYPQDAFVKKIEGTVLVEILIGADGRIARARVIRSVPQLDAAALASVRQWVFAPGLKKGRPVATLAQAPITFRIY